MAHANEARQTKDTDVPGCSEASMAEIAADFVLREAARSVDSIDIETLYPTEIAMRISALGIVSRANYALTTHISQRSNPRLLALPFYSPNMNGHHDLWRILVSSHDRMAETVTTHDWLVDTDAERCLMIPSESDVREVGKVAVGGPAVTLQYTPQVRAGLVEGASYAKFLENLGDEELGTGTNPRLFLEDTQPFIGGRATALDMRNPDSFVHRLGVDS